MVLLVFVYKAFENFHCLVIGRLWHIDCLEAALKSLVFLNVLAIFFYGGGTDELQVSICKHWLHHIPSIHGPFCTASSNNHVKLVNHQDDFPLGVDNFFDDILQPLFKVTSIFGASQKPRQIQRHDTLALQELGEVQAAFADSLCEPLCNCGLSYARIANEDWIVLLAARQDLDGAFDLRATTNNWVELTLFCHLGQVARILLKRCCFATRLATST
mmetsp:Transcript_3353/g.5952  ORF Transcript_3353/g.5952 Transcript_3353/m.5952 type:complete len:216 (+) Transcript_3353:742-1389(+)